MAASAKWFVLFLKICLILTAHGQYFEEQPDDVAAFVNESVELRCRANESYLLGNVQLDWTKDGSSIIGNDNIEILDNDWSVSGNFSIKISNLSMTDEGDYICTFNKTNNESTSSEPAHLTILVVPNVSELELNSTQVSGKVTIFATELQLFWCGAADGNPEPEISWFLDAEDITSSAESNATQDNDTLLTTTESYLNYRFASHDDGKSLICEVSIHEQLPPEQVNITLDVRRGPYFIDPPGQDCSESSKLGAALSLSTPVFCSKPRFTRVIWSWGSKSNSTNETTEIDDFRTITITEADEVNVTDECFKVTLHTKELINEDFDNWTLEVELDVDELNVTRGLLYECEIKEDKEGVDETNIGLIIGLTLAGVLLVVVLVLLIIAYWKKLFCFNNLKTQDSAVPLEPPTGKTRPPPPIPPSSDGTKSHYRVLKSVASNQIKFLEELGEGGTSRITEVHKARSTQLPGRTYVAVKYVSPSAHRTHPQKTELFQKELEALRQLQEKPIHDNVVQLLGVSEDHYKGQMMILEYAQNRDLKTYLLSQSGDDMYEKPDVLTEYQNLSNNMTRDVKFSLQILSGLIHLLSEKFLCYDLAARHVLVTENLTCKLTRFGKEEDVIKERVRQLANKENVALPVRWMAPESLLYNMYSVKSDVWSFGVLMWEISNNGATPYPDLSNAEKVKTAVRQGYHLKKTDKIGTDLYAIMRMCWKELANERPSYLELNNDLHRLAQSLSM